MLCRNLTRFGCSKASCEQKDQDPRVSLHPSNRPLLIAACITFILLSACRPEPLPDPPITRQPGEIVLMQDRFGIYFVYLPQSAPAGPEILVLVHGTPKDDGPEVVAHDLAYHWIDFAEQHDLLLIAPVFNQENFSSYLGDHAMGGYRGLFGSDIAADQWVLRLVKGCRAAFGSAAESFYLYGHSAGGQFTARFLVTHPESVKRAVITSAATYPQPDTEIAWPFGMGELHADIAWKTTKVNHVDVVPDKDTWLEATQVPLTVIVGLNDTAELRADLIPGQGGRNRLTIGKNWVQSMATFAESNGLESHLAFEIIPGFGHTMTGLLPYSQEALIPPSN